MQLRKDGLEPAPDVRLVCVEATVQRVALEQRVADVIVENPISNTLIIEGILTLIFFGAVLLSLHIKDYTFFIFHLMLALGFGIVFIVSWRERKRCASIRMGLSIGHAR